MLYNGVLEREGGVYNYFGKIAMRLGKNSSLEGGDRTEINLEGKDDRLSIKVDRLLYDTRNRLQEWKQNGVINYKESSVENERNGEISARGDCGFY